MKQTPDVLLKKPYNIYAKDIAVCIHCTEEYQKISIHQLLTKMGAKPIGTKSVGDVLLDVIAGIGNIFINMCTIMEKGSTDDI